ncbi:exopolygalacturonase-like protein [Tanacetum coccineum]
MFSFIQLLPLLSLYLATAYPVLTTFNVLSYGARPNRITDNSKISLVGPTRLLMCLVFQAFLRAWNDACESNTGARILVPRGTYVLGAVMFVGPCKGRVNFIIKGHLEASDNPANLFLDHWITFKYVDRLVVSGGGYLLGHGGTAWHHNDCATNRRCRSLPATMRFDFVTNSRINHIKSINSRNIHFNLFACHNVLMSHIRISAPEWSPNTDGIHIGASSQIKIQDSIISTGDDCVSMVSGSQDIEIQRVHCGPGHGFSIGSLGGSHSELHVRGIVIKNSSLSETQNGLRIKTWAPSLPSLASDIIFEDIVMNNVNNPIFIDQQYCPRPPCNWKAQSNVQIRNVTFSKVRGTSSSKVAVKLQCSKNVPCEVQDSCQTPPVKLYLYSPQEVIGDHLFQPLFDELLTPSPSVDYPSPEVVSQIHEVVAPVPVVSTGLPSSTNVDQDAPSPSDSQTTPETQPPVIPNDVEEDYLIIEVGTYGPVSTRLQLHEQALFCYYDAFLTAVEPKTYKDALTQSCWIEAMQEELNEFKRLGV